MQSGCAAEIQWLRRIYVVTFGVAGIGHQMLRGKLRVTRTIV